MTIEHLIDQTIATAVNQQTARNYLGMSQIGKKDTRTLWLQFRNCLPMEISPRVERIFRLGDAIENELIRYLQQIPDMQLHTQDQNGKQFRFYLFGGHFSGAMDGAIIGSEYITEWSVFEAKSVNDKRFNELVVKKLKDWSDEYYAQLQCYMGITGMKQSLFCAYNKNDSRIYTEIVPFIPMEWDALQVRALRIIESSTPPTSIYPNKTWYEAKWMAPISSAIYWSERLPPCAHCKNCRFSTPIIDDGNEPRWACQLAQSAIPDHVLMHGCTQHQWLPALLPFPAIESNTDYTAYQLANGSIIKNGAEEYLSSELAYASIINFTDLLTSAQLVRDRIEQGIDPIHANNLHELQDSDDLIF